MTRTIDRTALYTARFRENMRIIIGELTVLLAVSFFRSTLFGSAVTDPNRFLPSE